MPAGFPYRRVPLLPLAGMVLVILAVVAGLLLARAQTRANDLVRHTLEVELRIAEVLQLVRTVESTHRGYLIAGNESFREEVKVSIRQLRHAVIRLRARTQDNSLQQEALRTLDRLVAAKIDFALAGVDLVMRDRRGDAIRLVDMGRGQTLARAITDELAVMKGTEDRLLEVRIRDVEQVVWWLVAGQVAAIMLVMAVSALMMRDARIRTLAMEAARDAARESADAMRREMAARETAEGHLRQLQKMESIGHLAGGIAHDFNNMLAIVIGSLDMAQRRAGDPDRLARCLDNAREGADRAAALTARLLAFSRQQPLTPVAIDANRLVSGMSDLLRRTLGEQISVETILAGGLWSSYADASQLENAVLNLAVNARDAILATGGEGGRLTIATRNATLGEDYARDHAYAAPGDYVLIAVGDTGAGMTAEVMERCFDPFFTTKDVGKGTGLGLSQVFGFVKQSGGHVTIESTPGRGTTVQLYLPRFAEAPAAPPEAAGGTDAPAGRADEVILVVEDEERVRDHSVDALEELGYTAIAARDGPEALELLAENPRIGLLFTDVVMPGMGGNRLAREARTMRPDLRVLFTTGYARRATADGDAPDAGIAVLPKPFTIPQLAARVRHALDGEPR